MNVFGMALLGGGCFFLVYFVACLAFSVRALVKLCERGEDPKPGAALLPYSIGAACGLAIILIILSR